MRIGIIACESFKRALDNLVDGDPDIVYKEYLEFGLHTYPEVLRSTVVEKVNALEGRVDALFLGYGICNSLRNVTENVRVPTIHLEVDDCIGFLLTPKEYERERKKCAGTLYHTPYFAEMSNEIFEKSFRKELPNYEELGIDLEWYLDKLFDGYSRVLFIDDGLGDRERLETLSRQWALGRNLFHESRCGTLSLLKEGLARTKLLAMTITRAP